MTSLSVSQTVPDIWVVIPAAGVGARMGLDIPKQYLMLGDKTVIEHTLDRFAQLPGLAGIIVLVAERDAIWSQVEARLRAGDLASYLHVAVGAQERADTVVSGLSFAKYKLKISGDTWVMVHDAARPCVSSEDLNALSKVCVSDADGGLLASRVKDTMKRSQSSSLNVSHTEPRENLWHALTPQLFKLGDLLSALEAAIASGAKITDEASAMEQAGKQVVLVEGRADNIKLTTPSDLPFIDFLLQQQQRLTSNV